MNVFLCAMRSFPLICRAMCVPTNLCFRERQRDNLFGVSHMARRRFSRKSFHITEVNGHRRKYFALDYRFSCGLERMNKFVKFHHTRTKEDIDGKKLAFLRNIKSSFINMMAPSPINYSGFPVTTKLDPRYHHCFNCENVTQSKQSSCTPAGGSRRPPSRSR